MDKAISVMRAFGEEAHVGVGVSELARRADLSKSTTFRLLATLESNGVVERVGTAYRLGALLDDLSASKDSPLHDLARDALTPFLAELYEATHLTVQLAALRGSHVIYLNKLEGHQRLRSPSRIGGRMPAYCTAVGKVLLAGDGVAAEQALRSPRHRWTANTIVDEDAFADELDRVRSNGLALDRGESLETLACIAAPVRGANGQVVAALSVSGDAATFPALRYERVLRSVAYSASRVMSAQQRSRTAAA
ncbi:IclR family transcriptional regulator [Microbacterium thalassium]|nr:IclR family transcriptional regulator [Microbacterium thalassium]